MQHHAYNRLGSIGGGGWASTPSPRRLPARPPRRSPSLVRRPGKEGGSSSSSSSRRFPPAPRALIQRWALAVLALLLRPQAIFHFAPLIYVSGMLFYVGTVFFDSVPAIISRSPPGSPQLYERLQADMDADNSTDGVYQNQMVTYMLRRMVA